MPNGFFRGLLEGGVTELERRRTRQEEERKRQQDIETMLMTLGLKSQFEEEAEKRKREFELGKEKRGREFELEKLLTQYGLEEPKRRAERAKAVRETLSAIAKGEYPISAGLEEFAPEELGIRRPAFDITGLKGTPETLAGVQRLPYGVEARGTPEFLARYTRGEFPLEAQERIRGGYQQQQKKNISEIIKENAYRRYQQGDRSPEVLKVLGMWISPYEASVAKELGFGTSPVDRGITLPTEITTTSQAIDYLIENYNMNLEQAIDWIRSQ